MVMIVSSTLTATHIRKGGREVTTGDCIPRGSHEGRSLARRLSREAYDRFPSYLCVARGSL